MGVVIISTVVFILSTMPQLTDDIDMILFKNNTNTDTNDNNNDNNEPKHAPVERWEDVSKVLP